MGTISRISLLASTFILSGAGSAWAASSSDFWVEPSTILLSTLATILAGLAIDLFAKFRKKIGLDLSAKNEEALNDLIRQAIYYAEEWAAAQLKAKYKASGDEKLEKALEFVAERAPGIKRDEAIKRVMSALGQTVQWSGPVLGALKHVKLPKNIKF